MKPESLFPLANAPCSWGVLEFASNQPGPGYGQVLDEMAAAGYAGTELGDWGFMPTEPGDLRAELASRLLALVGAFVPVALVHPEAHGPGARTAVRTAELLAAATGSTSPVIVLADDNGQVEARTRFAGRIRPEHGLQPEQWDTFARGAEHVARAVREATGLRTVFHHHCAGYVETPGEVDALMARTDPEILGLCLDTGHLRYAGGDPLDVLERHAPRIRHVHFKDCHPVVAEQARQSGWDYFAAIRHGVFCELGQGRVDFPAVRDALRERRYPGWIVVEQDVLPSMGSPAASARRNREYLASIGL